jgi:hypothetical protein
MASKWSVRPGWRRRLWPLVTLVALVVTWSLLIWLAGKCDVAASVKDQFFAGCTEFWLARYQTFIAALIALSAAVMAVVPVYKQLRETRIQSAVQTHEMLRQHSLLLQEERSWPGPFSHRPKPQTGTSAC